MDIERVLDRTELDLLERCPEIAIVKSGAVYPDSVPGLTLLSIHNAHARCAITLQGAQVLSFIPHSQPDLLWVSPLAKFAPGRSVRGGIPVCLPWFGVNRRAPEKPRHGFARTSRWRLEHASTSNSGATRLKLTLRQHATEPHPNFAHRFEAALTVTIATVLDLDLRVVNRSHSPMPLSWALHSYHPIVNLDATTVTGLEGLEYLDNTRGLERNRQDQPLRFTGEFDRVYLNVGEEQIIHRGPKGPDIRVRGQNAPSAIVWNPGAELAASLPDLGESGHRNFICVERGAAFGDEQWLAPDHAVEARVSIGLGSI